MRTELFEYSLPPELIARHAPPERDAGRLLVVREDKFEHRQVKELAALVPAGALLVVNDSRVLRARLLGHRQGSGGKVEVLLLRRLTAPGAVERWEALGRASKPLRPGSIVLAGSIQIEVAEQGEGGVLVVIVRAAPSIEAALERDGRVPIPPYLEREDDEDDRLRYQTVYAARGGSVAAPTAGLHLSEALLGALEARGVTLAKITLHVGLGTFRPVTAADLEDHVMHAESLDVSSAVCEQIERARARGAPVVAVGTTVVRALESAADSARPGLVRETHGPTSLFIKPGHRFHVVDALLTNFHMPKSTLLALVSAFVGRERLLEAYRAAVSEGYRFLSYGDAMWIPRRLAGDRSPGSPFE